MGQEKSGTYELPVRSITYAMKGQQALRRRGITSWVGRDRAVKTGCGYVLTARGSLPKILSILDAAGVQITGREREVR